MTMPPAEHNTMNGAQPWVDPPNPGVVLRLPANTAQRQIAIATDMHNRNAKGWNTWIKLSAKLKQQVFDNTKDWNTWIELSAKLKQQVFDAADKAHLAELEAQHR
jgi:hypothetical protein